MSFPLANTKQGGRRAARGGCKSAVDAIAPGDETWIDAAERARGSVRMRAWHARCGGVLWVEFGEWGRVRNHETGFYGGLAHEAVYYEGDGEWKMEDGKALRACPRCGAELHADAVVGELAMEGIRDAALASIDATEDEDLTDAHFDQAAVGMAFDLSRGRDPEHVAAVWGVTLDALPPAAMESDAGLADEEVAA